MTDYIPYRRGTVLAPSGPCDHLHIVCCDPVTDGVFNAVNGCQCVLVVNVSSVKGLAGEDLTCVLHNGEHPFINRDSYVVYKEAVLWRVPAVVDKIAIGEMTVQADLDPDVFATVIDGFQQSERCKAKIKTFAAKYC